MSIRRTAAKRDKNERDIINALQACGCTVQQLSMKGVPDLLVGFIDSYTGEMHNYLIEVKDKGGKLTMDEIAWQAQWRGPVFVVYTVEHALELIGR